MGDSDQEGYDPNISYQEGAGYVGPSGQVTNYVPTAPAAGPAPVNTSMWDYAKAQNTGFNYTPQQLGWDAAATQRFADAGITNLPQWMNTTSLYSPEFHRGSGDFVQSYIDLYNTPIDQAVGQWSGAKKANQFLTGSGGSADDPAFREAYLRTSLGNMYNARDSWWDRNEGMVMGIGGVASVAGAAALGGAGLAGEAAAGVGEGGMTAAEAGALAGESAAGYGAGGAAGGVAGATGAGAAAGGDWLGALEGGMGAYGSGGAGPAGELGTIGGAGGMTVGSGDGIADAISAGQAGGADVGMGNGTSWLTDLGLPASYGNDLGALLSYGGDVLSGLDWGSLLKSGLDLGKLLGGGGVVPVTGTGSSGGGGTTSAPQTSQIMPSAPMNAGQPVAPATMPTGSIMGAFGNKGGNDDYKKYFSTLF
jgi:hypothetical protein